MPGFSLNTIASSLTAAAAAASQNAGDKISNVGSDPDAAKLSELQAATAQTQNLTDLAATVTEQFTKNTGKIIDKMV